MIVIYTKKIIFNFYNIIISMIDFLKIDINNINLDNVNLDNNTNYLFNNFCYPTIKIKKLEFRNINYNFIY